MIFRDMFYSPEGEVSLLLVAEDLTTNVTSPDNSPELHGLDFGAMRDLSLTILRSNGMLEQFGVKKDDAIDGMFVFLA